MLAFRPERKRLELESLHPGVTLADVQSRTGFPLHAPDPPAITAPPSARDLELLRTTVRERLAAFYPQFVSREAGG